MKAIICILTLLLSTYSLLAQEKIAEIQTTHFTVTGQPGLNMGTTKMPILFELYKDSLVFNYQSKAVIKGLKKKGLSSRQTMVKTFTKEITPYSEIYIFQDEDEKITVMFPKGEKPMVKIQNKDTFSGKVVEQLYISL